MEWSVAECGFPHLESKTIPPSREELNLEGNERLGDEMTPHIRV